MAITRNCPLIKLSKQPLALVLIQVRYSVISNMTEYVSSIQDALRRAGFPLETSKKAIKLDISPKEIRQVLIDQWRFETPDKTSSVILDEGQVLLQTTEYDTFEPFLARFLSVFDMIMHETEHTAFGILQRLGLRYVDVVRKQNEDDTIDSYLNSGMTGMESAFFQNQNKRYFLAFTGKTALPQSETGALAVRISRGDEESIDLPPDIREEAPIYAVRIPAGEDRAVIDMDHAWEGQLGPGVDKGRVEELFFGLHDTIIEVFHESVVTKEGIEKWK